MTLPGSGEAWKPKKATHTLTYSSIFSHCDLVVLFHPLWFLFKLNPSALHLKHSSRLAQGLLLCPSLLFLSGYLIHKHCVLCQPPRGSSQTYISSSDLSTELQTQVSSAHLVRPPECLKGTTNLVRSLLIPFICTTGPLLGQSSSVIGTIIHADLEGVFTFPIQFTYKPCQFCLLNSS